VHALETGKVFEMLEPDVRDLCAIKVYVFEIRQILQVNEPRVAHLRVAQTKVF
jgi:hypothetical protein